MIDVLSIKHDESIVTPIVTSTVTSTTIIPIVTSKTVTPTVSIISAMVTYTTSNRKRKRNQMPNLQIRTDLMQKYQNKTLKKKWMT